MPLEASERGISERTDLGDAVGQGPPETRTAPSTKLSWAPQG